MSKLSLEQIAHLKLLLSIDGIGPIKLRNLIAKFETTRNILSAPIESLIQTEGINDLLASKIVELRKSIEKFNKITELELIFLEKINSRLITIWDDEYPYLLKKIYDPPIFLYYRGEFLNEDNYSIAIVGTRQPTNYGKIQTEKLVSDLALQKITIVSGLARGIDSVAHRTALKNGGRTIAVLGCGIDVIYPPENKKLFDEICENGLIISEYPPRTKPDALNFPKRNRIISGLSLGTVVIETAETGGALQTASFALDQNREVFALPGNVGVRQSEGTNCIIKKGTAKLITCSSDILDELKIKLKPVANKEYPREKIQLTIFEEKILSLLSNEPKYIDLVASQSSFSTQECLTHLLTLEIKGLVKQLPGNNFVLL